MIDLLFPVVRYLVFLLIFVIGLALAYVAFIFIYDLLQTKDSIRRNFPVIGRFRRMFIHLGTFFRQYFFAMDREEQPFNRATRDWVAEKSYNRSGKIGFGSTNDLRVPGSIIFVNSPYPTLEEDKQKILPRVIGENLDTPYQPQHIVNISGMSYGALSKPAIRALSLGAKEAGIWLNTGEGGLSAYHLEGGCDLAFQIGTAKFGVRDEKGRLNKNKLKEIARHENVKMFELKMAQGAKPGKGGILPGVKVTREIAKIRGISPGKDAISPNRHKEISNPDELLDMLARIRDITGKPVGMKTVISTSYYPERLMNTILRRGVDYAPDFITLDGGEGGSGAAPQALADFVGLPLNESLPILSNLLIKSGLKQHITLIASGKLVTPDRICWALAMGADYTVSARGFMFALGCIQSLQCHKDTCPTGITTHNKRLQNGLVVKRKKHRVANYARHINEEIEIIAHSCGLKSATEFNRYNVRIVQTAGVSKLLSELYPYPKSINDS